MIATCSIKSVNVLVTRQYQTLNLHLQMCASLDVELSIGCQAHLPGVARWQRYLKLAGATPLREGTCRDRASAKRELARVVTHPSHCGSANAINPPSTTQIKAVFVSQLILSPKERFPFCACTFSLRDLPAHLSLPTFSIASCPIGSAIKLDSLRRYTPHFTDHLPTDRIVAQTTLATYNKHPTSDNPTQLTLGSTRTKKN